MHLGLLADDRIGLLGVLLQDFERLRRVVVVIADRVADACQEGRHSRPQVGGAVAQDDVAQRASK